MEGGRAGGGNTVNEIAFSNFEESGNKVVFSGRVGLDNVASLTTHIQIVNLGVCRNTSRTRSDVEHVTAILECTSCLGCVDGQSVVHSFNLERN
jgi:hypothetical protein